VRLDVLPDHLLQSSGIHLRRAEGGALPADASLFEIVADFERHHPGALGAAQWQPDRSRRRLACAAVYVEPED
jgi:hypothetical protein